MSANGEYLKTGHLAKLYQRTMRAHRRRLGITIGEVAVLCHVPPDVVTSWEEMAMQIDPIARAQILRFFNQKSEAQAGSSKFGEPPDKPAGAATQMRLSVVPPKAAIAQAAPLVADAIQRMIALPFEELTADAKKVHKEHLEAAALTADAMRPVIVYLLARVWAQEDAKMQKARMEGRASA